MTTATEKALRCLGFTRVCPLSVEYISTIDPWEALTCEDIFTVLVRHSDAQSDSLGTKEFALPMAACADDSLSH